MCACHDLVHKAFFVACIHYSCPWIATNCGYDVMSCSPSSEFTLWTLFIHCSKDKNGHVAYCWPACFICQCHKPNFYNETKAFHSEWRIWRTSPALCMSIKAIIFATHMDSWVLSQLMNSNTWVHLQVSTEYLRKSCRIVSWVPCQAIKNSRLSAVKVKVSQPQRDKFTMVWIFNKMT